MDKTRQLRGAYSKGFEAGLQKGLDIRRQEGWKSIETQEEFESLNHGELVKVMVETMSGFQGILRVYNGPFGNETHRIDLGEDDPFTRVDCCPWELARKVVIKL